MIDSIGSTMLPPSAMKPAIDSVPSPTGSFEDALEKARADSDDKILHEEARKLVAEAFIAPLLAKIR